MSQLRSLLSWIAAFLALLVIPGIYYLGEWLPPLKALDAYLNAHPGLVTALTVFTLLTAFGGVFLLVGTQFIVRVGDERVTRMQGSSRNRGGRPTGRFRFPQLEVSSSFEDIATLGELKDAFRRGVWWSEPRWRRFTLMILGGLMLLFGLVGLFIVIFPAGVKLLFFLVLLYITVKITRAVVAAPYPEEDE